MSLPFTILVFALLSLRYILSTYIEYLKTDGDEKNRDLIKNTKLIGEYITYMIIGLVILGFSLYFRKQYNEYYKTWSTFKFIFGVNKCKSLS